MLLRLTPKEWTVYSAAYRRIMAENGTPVLLQQVCKRLQWGDVDD